MTVTFDQPTTLSFSVLPPLYLPYYNAWCANVYHRYKAFSHTPFTIDCSSTSGAPVVIAGGKFFGFLNETGGSFAFDGSGTLTVTCPAGQTLFYEESCDPYAAWASYTSLVTAAWEAPHVEAFWSGLEYCTWVDQKREAILHGSSNMQSHLTEAYVYDYMRRIDRMGLPKGKLTIDDGWDTKYDGARRIYGDWEIDREKFPHMEQLVKDMTAEGYIPGLWFAPFTATPDCKFARQHPQIIKDAWQKNSELGFQWTFFEPTPENEELLSSYYTSILEPYISMGFRKLKMDISYGAKHKMTALMRIIYQAVKRLDPTVEVEAHVPDPFVSRYCDTVRINDVSLSCSDWRAITMEHYKVCRFSSPHKILNLDHLGTNEPNPAEDAFLEHTSLLLGLEGGYPCVSLLPDRFSSAAVDRFVAEVCAWDKKWQNAHNA